jgi:hypothetical protein
VDARQSIVSLLEKALEAARAGSDLSEVGQLVLKASVAAGTPSSIMQLTREARAKGFGAEADLLGMAIDVVNNAEQRGEVYEHTLINLHDLACDRLDQLEDEKHAPPAPTPSKDSNRLN